MDSQDVYIRKQLPKEGTGIVDMFLFGMVMMIFSFGSYNLFVSKLDNVSRDTRSNEIRPKWVQVENFGELKAIFNKVVIMILIITFLEIKQVFGCLKQSDLSRCISWWNEYVKIGNSSYGKMLDVNYDK